MKHITFYLDFISPYAYLAFEKLPEALQGLSYSVDYKPVLFAGLLKHHGQLGPAEIPGKRDWTYRQVLWLAHSHGVPLQMPAAHPFNPLALLRLALACDAQGLPNRYVCETVLRHVWRGGADAVDPRACRTWCNTSATRAGPRGRACQSFAQGHTDEAIARDCLACPPLQWTASCSGALMPCPCCAPAWTATPGLPITGNQSSAPRRHHRQAKG
jgi:2-hydroxychromene-2-carboxylate isomerase